MYMNSEADGMGQSLFPGADGATNPIGDDDPVLREMAQLRQVYLNQSKRRERELAEVKSMVNRESRRTTQLERDLNTLKTSLQAAEARADTMAAQADQLAAHLRRIYSAVFRGGVFGLIL